MIFRVDKRFFKPATIERWVVVIYERSQRFGQAQAQEMITGLVTSCEQVGMFIESDVVTPSTLFMRSSTGITVRDRDPIVSWENGQGNISDVRSLFYCLGVRMQFMVLFVNLAIACSGSGMYAEIQKPADFDGGNFFLLLTLK